MIVVFVCLLADAVLGTCGAQSSCVSCVNENTNCFWCPSMGACDRDGNVCNGEKTRSCASPPPPPCGPPVNVCGTSTGCFVLVTRAKCVALRCVCVCACWFSSLIYVFFFRIVVVFLCVQLRVNVNYDALRRCQLSQLSLRLRTGYSSIQMYRRRKQRLCFVITSPSICWLAGSFSGLRVRRRAARACKRALQRKWRKSDKCAQWEGVVVVVALFVAFNVVFLFRFKGSSCGTAQTTQSCTGTMCPVDCVPLGWSAWCVFVCFLFLCFVIRNHAYIYTQVAVQPNVWRWFLEESSSAQCRPPAGLWRQIVSTFVRLNSQF